jgi:hypothetical protein
LASSAAAARGGALTDGVTASSGAAVPCFTAFRTGAESTSASLVSVEVCAPPELLTVTTGPSSFTTTVVDDGPAESDEGTPSEGRNVPSPPVVGFGSVDSVLGDDTVGAVFAGGDAAAGAPSAGWGSEIESDGDAHAIPGVVATASPSPIATAKAPTRPT